MNMDQQFSLSWNNFHGNLSKGFSGLLGKKEFVDVTIAVDGHLLQAHKVILSICSPYFKKMFQMNPCQHPIVVLRDVSHKAMQDLLQFMYHGEVSVKREDLTSFIGTAEVLQIKGLTNKDVDEDSSDTEQDTSQMASDTEANNTTQPELFKENYNNDITQPIELIKQSQIIDKLHRLSNLKRKSEQYLQKNYYADLINSEKRPKFREKICNMFVQNHFENLKNPYKEDVSETNNEPQKTANENIDKDTDEMVTENSIELKTECDDSDIVITDPAVCSPDKNYENMRHARRDSSLPLDYTPPQENCAGLNSLLVDLKNLVNGKAPSIFNQNEEIPRQTLEHRLVTIPQKEDGKKKYPQRSCRLCWKIGRRRDTRFMCSACDMPFCKYPCFGVHFKEVLNVFHLDQQ